jgi:hypothetical protein
MLDILRAYLPDQPPFVDETGIIGNIDISMNYLMSDFDEANKALNYNGLYLVRGLKEMKVLVIRDSRRAQTTVVN